MQTQPEPRQATLAEQLFADIQRSIVEGKIPQGSKISEPELARIYGVSRGPLREAISRLEARSLVVRTPNAGARVVSLSISQLLEIFAVREALEGMAARLAAEHMAREEVAALRLLLVEHGRQVEIQEGRAYFQREGDLDFHYRIVLGSGNQRLIGLLCDDLYHLVRLYRYQFGMPSPRAGRALREHEQVVDAIDDRDGELAEILMRRHIRASRRNLERRLQKRGPQR